MKKAVPSAPGSTRSRPTRPSTPCARSAGTRRSASTSGCRAAPGESESGGLIDLLISDEPGPLAELQGEERREWVRESVARLPETLRQTLILAYHQDLKYREIAEILKIPVGTVKSRLHAALAKLQQMARVRPS